MQGPALTGTVISQVDLGDAVTDGGLCGCHAASRRTPLQTRRRPMKMITFDTQMTFYPRRDNTGSFFRSDIRGCVGVTQVKSIILMEK